MKSIRPKCGLENCNEDHYAKGYCKAHYNRIWQGRKLNVHIPIGRGFNPQKRGLCTVKGCKNKHYCKKLCQNHYVAIRKTTVANKEQRKCSFPGCAFLHYAHEFCYFHHELKGYQGWTLEVKNNSDFESEIG